MHICMGVATTTDTTDSVRTSFEMLKNLYGMSVQVDETTKRKIRGKFTILKSKINAKVIFILIDHLFFYKFMVSNFSNNL